MAALSLKSRNCMFVRSDNSEQNHEIAIQLALFSCLGLNEF